MRFIVVFVLVAWVSSIVRAARPSPLLLWYPAPAKAWTEALPLGDGRLGAMVFGGAPEERLALNEDTVWAGGPHNNNIPTAREAIVEARRLIFAGDFAAAQALAGEKIMPGKSRPNGMPYQPVGDLLLHFPGHEAFTHYRRELSLDEATARTSYDVGGVHYTREIFTSLADHVIVVRLTADKPGTLAFTASWASLQKTATRRDRDETLVLSGSTTGHEGVPGDQLKFVTQVRVLASDGKVAVTDSALELTGASEATLLVAIGTNFVNYHDLSADPTA